MCHEDRRELTFETMLNDPMIRLVMRADGVSVRELVDVLQVARGAVAAREQAAVRRALSAHCAMSGLA